MSQILRDQLRASVALERTRDGIIDALRPRPSADVFDLERLRAKAVWAAVRTLKNGAREYLRAPDSLHKLTPTLADAERCIRSEIDRRGHWTFDFNRLIALRQARLAHRFLRRFPEAR